MMEVNINNQFPMVTHSVLMKPISLTCEEAEPVEGIDLSEIIEEIEGEWIG